MAMSDKRILEAMIRGDITIDPYNENQLSTSSYDVRLGEFFYREQHPRFKSNIFNVYDQDHVQRVWGRPQQAPLALDVLDTNDLVGIEPKDRVIVLSPGESILAHTEEFIGGTNCITTMMKARSSMGRCFISVCLDAGWGDIGYRTRWTFEVTNRSQHYSIPLLVGSRVGQIVFMEAGPIRDKDYTKTGAYQTSDDLETLKANWKPSDMLPKVRP